MADEEGVVDRYYEEIRIAEQLRAEGRLEEGLAAALVNLDRVPALVSSMVSEYGSFDLDSIPPIEQGCLLAALLGDDAALSRIHSVVESRKELARWREVVLRARTDAATVRAALQHVEEHPGSLRSALGRIIGGDGRSVSELAYDLALGGLLRREKQGRSYALYLPDAKPATLPA